MVGCSDGKIVRWSLSTLPDAELVNTILDNVIETLNAVERLVIHRDRGGIIAGRADWQLRGQQKLRCHTGPE